MNNTAIKVCGVTSLADLQWLNDSGIDYVGLVFVEGSKRQVTPEQVTVMLQQVDLNVITVGIFMNQPMDWVAEVMAQTGWILPSYMAMNHWRILPACRIRW